MSDFVLDASLALQWFLEDEADRKYSLNNEAYLVLAMKYNSILATTDNAIRRAAASTGVRIL